MTGSLARTLLLAACTALMAPSVQAQADSGSGTTGVGRLIVKFRGDSDKRTLPAKTRVALLADARKVKLSHVREMALDAQVVALDHYVTLAEARSIAAQLAADPEVEFAEPDRRVKPQIVPNDSLIGTQTYLADTAAGISAFSAWEISTGSPNIVVAVVDTGYLPHAGLAGRFLRGYDFISDPFVANDGDGRDADATDPGDWVASEDLARLEPDEECIVGNSTWHGTAVAGIIAANSDDGIWTAGIDWAAKILPVRALGKCGGVTSDIVDAIAWAAGLRVPGAPINTTPAQVINLSLGDKDRGSCSASEQAVINAALAAGVTRAIVVAAGNEAEDATQHAPANCNNVITVAATTSKGGRATYSNYGTNVTISAPGGEYSVARFLDGIPVLVNSGLHQPVADATTIYNGTSFAAPMVSGVVSLMLSVAPDLSSDQVRTLLKSTVKRFPDNLNCTPTLCGPGILNAQAAVSAAKALAPPAVNYEGLWWRAPGGSEAGWGINLSHQGDTIFATWFTYDSAGKAWWLSMTAQKAAAGTYTGTLNATHGPAFSAVPFDPSLVSVTPVGSGTLTFGDAGTGRFIYTVNGVSQNKPITRELFGAAPTCAFGSESNLSLATNYQDLWWRAPGASEAGWGINLTHEGDTIFLTWFTYNTDGTPLWLSATAVKNGPGVYAGTLLQTSGPAFSAVPFDPAQVTSVPVGSATLTFSDGNNATFAYVVNGIAQTKPITREVLIAPGTVCR